jgi:hypothetical protein
LARELTMACSQSQCTKTSIRMGPLQFEEDVTLVKPAVKVNVEQKRHEAADGSLSQHVDLTVTAGSKAVGIVPGRQSPGV